MIGTSPDPDINKAASRRQPTGPGRLIVGARVHTRRHDSSTFEVAGKAAVVLALLALEGQADRRRVALLLWPDSPESQARTNLRTLVHRLNQRFGAELLVGAEHLHIDPAQASVVLQDTEALLSALGAGGPQACELLAQAGVKADGSGPLQAWLEGSRQRLRRIQLVGLCEALAEAQARADAAPAIALARACVQLEPLSEHWHRQLMDTLARCGDRAAALAAYEDCKVQLRQQLGVLPDMQTRTVQLRILQGQARVASAPQSVAAGLTPLGGAARFPLVEREAVLAEVQAALARGQHVVLQGEAGVGKTRLLRHLAERGEVEQVALRPGAREEPFAAVAQLLQEVQPRRAARIGLAEQVELARLAPLAFPEVQPSQARLSALRLHAALRKWAGRLAETGVQRLVLDDLHYADVASQAAFAALLAPPEEGAAQGLPLLLAYRSGEIGATLAEALVAAQVRGQAKSITLQRLSLQGVQALLHAMHVEQPEAQAARLLQRTGGNPLFVIELMRHALEENKETTPAGANLDALLRSRLAACSMAAQQLAAVAAVAAQDFTVELAAAVTAQAPLALMPAWSELQQRGLFADHGLAHDLLREAVLGALPSAIGRTLHRQVAVHLEGLSLKGTRMLVHWLAAEDFDRALPHAAHQLYTTSAAGLSTVKLEVDLLGLMARLSETVLLSNLWLSAEVDGVYRDEMALPWHWPDLAALVERVERMVRNEAVDHWLAFERSRLLFFRDHLANRAYAELCAAAERMPGIGIERAQVEVCLGNLAFQLNGTPHPHATRARSAVAGLAEQIEHERLFRVIEIECAFGFGTAELLRTKLAALRTARRRHDLGAVDVVRNEIAAHCALRCLAYSACRYFRLDARALLPDARLREEVLDLGLLGRIALSAGRFAAAVRFLKQDNQTTAQSSAGLFRTLVWIRLGQWSRAHAESKEIDLEEIEHRPDFLSACAIARREIDIHEGLDPLPALRQLVARARELGVDGVRRQMLDWDVAMLTVDSRERMMIGARILEELKVSVATAVRPPRLLIEVAEAHAQAGSGGGRVLVLEAARELRRGRTGYTFYVPVGLVRCARLLEASDPAEAAALMHVARRWVLQALPHVPEFARESFMTEVPVNRLLLGTPA